MKKETTGKSRNTKKVVCVLGLLLFVITLILFVLLNYRDTKEAAPNESQTDEMTNLSDKEEAALLESFPVPEKETKITDEELSEPEPEEPMPVPITTDEVVLTDIYAISGNEVVFKRYHKEAVSYQWEYYDFSVKDWKKVDKEKVTVITDELYRSVSACVVEAGSNKQEMVRCKIVYSNGREAVDYASLFVLQEQISGIRIMNYETNVNMYMNTLDIPIIVTYISGNEETITGLWGVKFLDVSKSVEYEETMSRNKVEKQITVITERDYMWTSKEPQDVLVRYMDGSLFEDFVKVTGVDREAPVIEQVTIGNYEVSSINKTVPIDINIIAEDNETPYPYLQYAFVHESKKPEEDDFHVSPSFCVDIDKNGIWIAYVKDEFGNYSTQENIIYAVDQKAPKLRLDIQNSEWCKENVIVAIAEDKTELKYRIRCDTQGILGEWNTNSSFTVTENGTYLISAMDAAGNVTVEEITVDNIDNESPIILGIKEVGGRNEK